MQVTDLPQFDDIPPLSVSEPNPDDVQPEPVFNPYHQFDFSDGWVVVPPPRAPYLPSSKPLFTEFIPNFNINGTNPMVNLPLFKPRSEAMYGTYCRILLLSIYERK